MSRNFACFSSKRSGSVFRVSENLTRNITRFECGMKYWKSCEMFKLRESSLIKEKFARNIDFIYLYNQWKKRLNARQMPKAFSGAIETADVVGSDESSGRFLFPFRRNSSFKGCGKRGRTWEDERVAAKAHCFGTTDAATPARTFHAKPSRRDGIAGANRISRVAH